MLVKYVLNGCANGRVCDYLSNYACISVSICVRMCVYMNSVEMYYYCEREKIATSSVNSGQCQHASESRIQQHKHTYIYTQVHTHTYRHTYLHRYTGIHSYTYTAIHTQIHRHTYIYIHRHTYIPTQIHSHTYIYIHTQIHRHTFIYTHTPIHTQSHATHQQEWNTRNFSTCCNKPIIRNVTQFCFNYRMYFFDIIYYSTADIKSNGRLVNASEY